MFVRSLCLCARLKILQGTCLPIFYRLFACRQLFNDSKPKDSHVVLNPLPPSTSTAV